MEFLTPEEKTRLEHQLEELKGRRKELSERIGAARELGDLKENAEYHAAKEDQGHNEARIRELEQRLANSAVHDTESMPEDLVFVGATVRLRNTANDDEDLYRIVGESTGVISEEFIEVTQNSPMGEALMRARVGETVRVDTPRGEKRFEILEIVG